MRVIKKESSGQSKETIPTCGIIMPISAMGNYPKEHWSDVYQILSDAITDSDFKPLMVSDADDSGVIHKRIIQNIYSNEMVVCDVSGKNPNVMFELGMRLTFDKPTIIVKDDKTTYSFDTSPIEHLTYPRDLRFQKIVDFKRSLTEKINGTYAKAKAESDYSPFLKNFGPFNVPSLNTKEVSKEDFVLEELASLRAAVEKSSRVHSYVSPYYALGASVPVSYPLGTWGGDRVCPNCGNSLVGDSCEKCACCWGPAA